MSSKIRKLMIQAALMTRFKWKNKIRSYRN